jgi:hypothetical protein
VSDNFSRYVLCISALPSQKGAEVKKGLERTFREYGLPDSLRTDNGPPFGALAAAPLSRLGAWLVKLGIRPEYIAPGKPQQNGRHERMHLTLKQETAMPPAATVKAQQRRFDEFRREFNDERPHEALDQTPPSSRYVRSLRPFPSKIPDVTYPSWFETRTVCDRGSIHWRNQKLFVSEALVGERVGLVEVDNGLWELYFAHLQIGRVHEGLLDCGVMRRNRRSPRAA